MARSRPGTHHGRARPSPGLLLVLLLGVPRADAQPPAAPSPSPSRLVVSFEQRTRVEGLTRPFRLDELGTTRVVAFRTRLQVALPKIVGPVGAFIEVQDSSSGWNDEPFLVEARHVNHLDFTQAHVRVAADGLFGGRARGGVLLGRYTLDLGRRRLVARNGMRNTTNAFDGVSGWLSTPDGSSLQAFVSRPVRLEPRELDRSDSARLFWGASVTARRWRFVQPEVYTLRLDESDETVTRKHLTTVGARLFRDPRPGQPDYETEIAWQAGHSGGQVHRAFFVHVEGGFTFRRGQARVTALFDHASGDEDPEDDSSGRFDTLAGARSFEFGPTGIYGPFFRGNIQGPGVRVVVTPGRTLEVGAAHRALWLAAAKDAWVGSGLQDPTGESGRFLGHHFEARFRWRASRWLLVEAMYAHLFKGSFLERVPGSPRTPDSDYVTVGFEVGGTILRR